MTVLSGRNAPVRTSTTVTLLSTSRWPAAGFCARSGTRNKNVERIRNAIAKKIREYGLMRGHCNRFRGDFSEGAKFGTRRDERCPVAISWEGTLWLRQSRSAELDHANGENSVRQPAGGRHCVCVLRHSG